MPALRAYRLLLIHTDKLFRLTSKEQKSGGCYLSVIALHKEHYISISERATPRPHSQRLPSDDDEGRRMKEGADVGYSSP